MPVGLGLKELAILGRMGSQSLLQRGAPSVLLSEGLRVCIAACSVRSSWDLLLVCVSMVVSFHPIPCPVVLEWWAAADLLVSRSAGPSGMVFLL